MRKKRVKYSVLSDTIAVSPAGDCNDLSIAGSCFTRLGLIINSHSLRCTRLSRDGVMLKEIYRRDGHRLVNPYGFAQNKSDT